MAGDRFVYCGCDECDGGGRLVCFVSGDAGDGRAADPGECYQYGGFVAGAVDVGYGAAEGLAKDLLPVTLTASVLGGVSGAVVLLNTKQMTFLHLVPWLLLVASLLFGISGPVSKWIKGRSLTPHEERKPALVPLFPILLPVCFYIGYFGAGAGFLIMTALALFGVEKMSELNSLKVTAACLSNLSAVITFVLSGAIIWHYCLISMVFAGVGGYVGAQYARRMNPDGLRAIRGGDGMSDRGLLLLEERMIDATDVDFIGYAAATFTTISFLPQLIRVMRLRTTRDIAEHVFDFFGGKCAVATYGLLTASRPMALANAVTFVLSIEHSGAEAAIRPAAAKEVMTV